MTKELKSLKINTLYVVMDISKEESVIKASEEIKIKFGKLYILINNKALMKVRATVEE